MRRVAPPQKANPVVVTEPLKLAFAPIVMEERNELAAMFANPVFVKAFRNAKSLRPSLWHGQFGGQFGQQGANNRLHELRGWEAFEIALLAQAQEPRVKPKGSPQENFPDSGTIDAAFKQS